MANDLINIIGKGIVIRGALSGGGDLVIEGRVEGQIALKNHLTIESSGMDTVGRTSGRPSPWLGGLDLAAQGGSLPRLASQAGCAIWSPFWRNVTAENVKEAQALGLKVIPWTLNNPAEMARLIDLGVDGLITDYPDRAQPVLAAKGLKSR